MTSSGNKKQLHASIRSSRAALSVLVLAVAQLFPVALMVFVSSQVADLALRVEAGALLVLAVSLLGLLAFLLFRMSTAGAVLLFGTFLCVYAVLTVALTQVWLNRLAKVNPEVRHLDVFGIDVTVFVGMAQNTFSWFAAAAGAGLFSAALFASRVVPRAPDNDSGHARSTNP